MKNLLYIISIAALLAACTNEIENDAAQTDILTLTVGDFPTFGEDAATRAIGTTDAGGKSAWEAGDQLLVSVTCSSDEPQYAVMSYDGSTWITTPTLRQTYASYTVTAWYAPAYQWSTTNEGTLELREGEQAGLDECIMATSNSSPNITFTSNGREYSRLRIASTSNTQLSVSLTGFTPAGSATAGNNNYTLTTDSKGNAYLYGTWTTGCNMTVTARYSSSGSTQLFSNTLSNASSNGQSFAANAIPTGDSYNSIGDGTEAYPYIICNQAQLSSLTQITSDITGHYKLGTDISLTGNWTPIGQDNNPNDASNPGRFTGTFDGGNHTLSNLTITSPSSNCNGLFRMVGSGGTVKNLTIDNCNISNSPSFTGGIAGYCIGTIENCHINGGNISGNNISIGGIVGLSETGGTIIACSNSATITNTSREVGGIVGTSNNNGTYIIACYNTGNVTGSSTRVGGIVGISRATITSCFNTGTVSGNSQVGQIVGSLSGGSTTACFDNTTTDWVTATETMNAQLGNYNYRYVQRNGTGQPPVIEATEESQ